MKGTQQLQYVEAQVPVFFVEEEGQWVAFCPALDVSSYGDTIEEAKVAFEEALEIFIEETVDRGTLEKELLRMGWTLSSKEYVPPTIAKRNNPMFQSKEREDRIVRMPTVGTNRGQAFA